METFCWLLEYMSTTFCHGWTCFQFYTVEIPSTLQVVQSDCLFVCTWTPYVDEKSLHSTSRSFHSTSRTEWLPLHLHSNSICGREVLPLNKSHRVTASSSVAVFRPSFMNSTLPRYMMIISDIATLKLHIRQFRNELFELSFVVFCILDSDTMFL